MKNIWIEKKGKALLDTRGEKQRIKLFAQRAALIKKAQKKALQPKKIIKKKNNPNSKKPFNSKDSSTMSKNLNKKRR